MHHRFFVRVAARLLAAPAVLLPGVGFAQSGAQSGIAQLPPASPNDPVERLSRYLRVLSTSPNSLDALKGAGRAALDVGDPSAAVGFFARAQEASPRDGRAKAGLAAALVQLEQPKDALKLFDEAEGLGVPASEFAADRGLAYDLRGDGRRAQADYRTALAARPGDDETVRRLALSLAMSGDRAGALSVLDPLLRRQDRAGWRASTFVLAMTGDKAGADTRVGQLMGQTQAQAMRPFLDRLATLRPAEQAAAVHFGHFPSTGTTRTGTRLAAANPTPAYAAPVRTAAPDRALVPSGPALGTASAPAAASPAPVSASPGFTDAFANARSADGRATRRRPGQAEVASTPMRVAGAEPAPAARTPAVPPASLASPVRITPPASQMLASAAVPAAASANAAAPAGSFVRMKRSGWATPDLPAAPPATVATPPVAGGVLASATGGPAVVPSPGATALATSVTGAGSASVPSSGSAGAGLSTGTALGSAALPATSISSAGPAAAPAASIAVASATPGVVAPSSAATVPASAPVAVADAAPSTPVIVAPRDVRAPVVAAPAKRVAASARGEAADDERTAVVLPGRGKVARLKLADADDAATDEPLAAALPGRGKVARLRLAEVEAGDLDAAKAATLPGRGKIAQLKMAQNDIDPEPRGRSRGKADADADQAGREAKKPTAREAKAKAVADAKEAKDAKAKAAKAAETKRAAKTAPERYWVQVAGGANRADLPKAWAQARTAHPQELAGRTPHTTPLRFTNRLLVGPFKTEDEAQAFVNRTAKSGWTTFAFTSPAGQKVEPVGGR